MSEAARIILLSRVVVVVLGLAFVAILVALFDDGALGNDFAQTVSVARNFIDGHGLQTSLIYYDIHYELGSDTVPQTVFPPGYSLLIALPIYLGVSTGWAAFSVCVLAFLLTGYLIERSVNMLTQSPLPAMLSVLLWFVMAVNWSNVLFCRSEVLFTCFSVASMYVICRWSARGEQSAGLVLCVGAAAAAAFLIRYQGVFLIASLGVFFLARAVGRRDLRSAVDTVGVMAAPACVFLIILLRNYIVSGRPGGGPIDYVQDTAGLNEVVMSFYYALTEILGVSKDKLLRGGLSEIFAIGLLLYFLWLISRRRAVRRIWNGFSRDSGVVFSLVYLSITIIAFMYLAVFKSLGYVQARYLSTIIPFAIVPLCVVASESIRTQRPSSQLRLTTLTGIALFTGFALFGQARAMQEQLAEVSSSVRLREIRTALDSQFEGQTVGEFLYSEIAVGNNLLSHESQLVGHVLQQPTFGMTPSKFTTRDFDQEEVLTIAVRNNIKYIVFFPALYFPELEKNRNRTILTQIQSKESFEWLEPLLRSDSVSVFAINVADCCDVSSID